MPLVLAPLADAITALQSGQMVILIDDPDRENEADLVMSAAYCTPEAVNFMIHQACGLLCVALSPQRAMYLDLPLMREEGDALHGTQFAISIDAKTGVGTGISAPDRARTIQLMADPQTVPTDFVRPGHIFPLIGHPGGLAARQGHTEGSLVLMEQAGLPPAAVIVEMLGADGLALHGNGLQQFATQYGLPIIAIAQLMACIPQATA